jgi:CRP/FNR family cyclic AMP-dependent transcriptional regulator
MALSKQDESFMRVYADKEVIFESGAPGREMFVVVKGEVAIYREQAGATEQLAVFKSGEMFGEMALITESPRTATARALCADTQLMVVDQARFVYLCSQQPAFALGVMRVLAQRLANANDLKEQRNGH